MSEERKEITYVNDLTRGQFVMHGLDMAGANAKTYTMRILPPLGDDGEQIVPLLTPESARSAKYWDGEIEHLTFGMPMKLMNFFIPSSATSTYMWGRCYDVLRDGKPWRNPRVRRFESPFEMFYKNASFKIKSEWRRYADGSDINPITGNAYSIPEAWFHWISDANNGDSFIRERPMLLARAIFSNVLGDVLPQWSEPRIMAFSGGCRESLGDLLVKADGSKALSMSNNKLGDICTLDHGRPITFAKDGEYSFGINASDTEVPLTKDYVIPAQFGWADALHIDHPESQIEWLIDNYGEDAFALFCRPWCKYSNGRVDENHKVFIPGTGKAMQIQPYKAGDLAKYPRVDMDQQPPAFDEGENEAAEQLAPPSMSINPTVVAASGSAMMPPVAIAPAPVAPAPVAPAPVAPVAVAPTPVAPAPPIPVMDTSGLVEDDDIPF